MFKISLIKKKEFENYMLENTARFRKGQRVNKILLPTLKVGHLLPFLLYISKFTFENTALLVDYILA